MLFSPGKSGDWSIHQLSSGLDISNASVDLLCLENTLPAVMPHQNTGDVMDVSAGKSSYQVVASQMDGVKHLHSGAVADVNLDVGKCGNGGNAGVSLSFRDDLLGISCADITHNTTPVNDNLQQREIRVGVHDLMTNATSIRNVEFESSTVTSSTSASCDKAVAVCSVKSSTFDDGSLVSNVRLSHSTIITDNELSVFFTSPVDGNSVKHKHRAAPKRRARRPNNDSLLNASNVDMLSSDGIADAKICSSHNIGTEADSQTCDNYSMLDTKTSSVQKLDSKVQDLDVSNQNMLVTVASCSLPTVSNQATVELCTDEKQVAIVAEVPVPSVVQSASVNSLDVNAGSSECQLSAVSHSGSKLLLKTANDDKVRNSELMLTEVSMDVGRGLLYTSTPKAVLLNKKLLSPAVTPLGPVKPAANGATPVSSVMQTDLSQTPVGRVRYTDANDNQTPVLCAVSSDAQLKTTDGSPISAGSVGVSDDRRRPEDMDWIGTSVSERTDVVEKPVGHMNKICDTVTPLHSHNSLVNRTKSYGSAGRMRRRFVYPTAAQIADGCPPRVFCFNRSSSSQFSSLSQQSHSSRHVPFDESTSLRECVDGLMDCGNAFPVDVQIETSPTKQSRRNGNGVNIENASGPLIDTCVEQPKVTSVDAETSSCCNHENVVSRDVHSGSQVNRLSDSDVEMAGDVSAENKSMTSVVGLVKESANEGSVGDSNSKVSGIELPVYDSVNGAGDNYGLPQDCSRVGASAESCHSQILLPNTESNRLLNVEVNVKSWETEVMREQDLAGAQLQELSEIGNKNECKSDFNLSKNERNHGFGFASASGKRITVSDKSKARAEKLMREVNLDCVAEMANNTDKMCSGESRGSAMFSPRNATVGFVSAAGKPVGVSAAAIQKAEKLMQEVLEEATASETVVNEKSLGSIIASVQSPSKRQQCGFSCASGKTLSVKMKNLVQAESLVEAVSLEVDECFKSRDLEGYKAASFKSVKCNYESKQFNGFRPFRAPRLHTDAKHVTQKVEVKEAAEETDKVTVSVPSAPHIHDMSNTPKKFVQSLHEACSMDSVDASDLTSTQRAEVDIVSVLAQQRADLFVSQPITPEKVEEQGRSSAEFLADNQNSVDDNNCRASRTESCEGAVVKMHIIESSSCTGEDHMVIGNSKSSQGGLAQCVVDNSLKDEFSNSLDNSNVVPCVIHQVGVECRGAGDDKNCVETNNEIERMRKSVTDRMKAAEFNDAYDWNSDLQANFDDSELDRMMELVDSHPPEQCSLNNVDAVGTFRSPASTNHVMVADEHCTSPTAVGEKLLPVTSANILIGNKDLNIPEETSVSRNNNNCRMEKKESGKCQTATEEQDQHSFMNVFRTARGKSVTIGKDALAKARSMLQSVIESDEVCSQGDDNLKSHDPSNTVSCFQTARGKRVEVSKEALAKARSMFDKQAMLEAEEAVDFVDCSTGNTAVNDAVETTVISTMPADGSVARQLISPHPKFLLSEDALQKKFTLNQTARDQAVTIDEEAYSGVRRSLEIDRSCESVDSWHCSERAATSSRKLNNGLLSAAHQEMNLDGKSAGVEYIQETETKSNKTEKHEDDSLAIPVIHVTVSPEIPLSVDKCVVSGQDESYKCKESQKIVRKGNLIPKSAAEVAITGEGHLEPGTSLPMNADRTVAVRDLTNKASWTPVLSMPESRFTDFLVCLLNLVL